GRARAVPGWLGKASDIVWILLVLAAAGYSAWIAVEYLRTTLGPDDVAGAVGLGLLTLARVVVLIVIASLIWVPIGVWIGLRPWAAELVQPVAQFLAAFPANVLRSEEHTSELQSR